MGMMEKSNTVMKALGGSGQPVAAQLAVDDVSLIDFAKKAGKNIFSVIPDATRTQKYLKGPANIHYVCDPEMVTEVHCGRVFKRFRPGPKNSGKCVFHPTSGPKHNISQYFVQILLFVVKNLKFVGPKIL